MCLRDQDLGKSDVDGYVVAIDARWSGCLGGFMLPLIFKARVLVTYDGSPYSSSANPGVPTIHCTEPYLRRLFPFLWPQSPFALGE